MGSNIYGKMFRSCWRVENWIRSHFGIYESEKKLATDSKKYWSGDYVNNVTIAQDAHWQNRGIFEDTSRWLALGKEHIDLISLYSGVLGIEFPIDRMVEWGCGGGANAVHFAPLTKEYIGIDISKDSLRECERQMNKFGYRNFIPVLVDAVDPESITSEDIFNNDLFLCTYVYELFPSPEYGITVLKLANSMLKKGGIAVIQIRYNDGRKGMASKRWGYGKNPYQMTTYTLEEFWKQTRYKGFQPFGIFMKPEQPLINDMCYAYYFLKKT